MLLSFNFYSPLDIYTIPKEHVVVPYKLHMYFNYINLI